MSHWLKSVNTLLEKLDDRAETVVAERTGIQEDENEGDIYDILAKRGLGSASRDEEDGGEVATNESGGLKLNFNDAVEKPSVEDAAAEQEATKEHPKPVLVSDPNTKEAPVVEPSAPPNTSQVLVPALHAPEKGETQKPPEQLEVVEPSEETIGATLPPEPRDKTKTNCDVNREEQKEEISKYGVAPIVPSATESSSSSKKSNPAMSPPKKKAPLAPPPKAAPPSKSQRNATAEVKEAQKEARTLRRHVVSLNSQLEAAESELQAQRKELELAAERMEKDRKKARNDKEVAQKNYAQELAALKSQHQQLLKEQQARFEYQIASFRATLEQVEDERKQEGGNMNKELAQLEAREQEMSNRMNMLE
jgi:hypothetical protein